MTASEVMRSASFRAMGSPVQVAHVGAQNGHLFERPLGTLWYDISSIHLEAKLYLVRFAIVWTTTCFS